MYNPLFITNTALGELITGLEVVVERSDHPDSISLDAAFTENGASFNIILDGAVWKKILIKKNFGYLYTYRDDDIVVVGRMPLRTQEFINVQVSPCCIRVKKEHEEPTVVLVSVESPLTAKVTDDILEIGVVVTAVGDEDESPGLLTINGIHPDTNGNFSIISKTSELSVECHHQIR